MDCPGAYIFDRPNAVLLHIVFVVETGTPKVSMLLNYACASEARKLVVMHAQVDEVAFTGDTTIDFVKDPANAPALRARLLIMECTFLDDAVDQEGAQARGHMHVRDLAEHADCFQVRVLHSSARELNIRG